MNMSKVKHGSQKSYGKTLPREGAYKQHGAKHPKSTHRKSHAMPHVTASSMHGRTGAGNSTVKNAA